MISQSYSKFIEITINLLLYMIWRTSSQIKLTLIKFNMELTYIGSKASILSLSHYLYTDNESIYFCYICIKSISINAPLTVSIHCNITLILTLYIGMLSFLEASIFDMELTPFTPTPPYYLFV